MTRTALITGAGGQLGQALSAQADRGQWQLVGLDSARLDIRDRDAVQQCLATHRPEVVFNCAAYTRVDQAESERTQAFAVNESGAAHVAAACAEHEARLIHLSTDYVFDGRQSLPYRETDATRPVSVYGASKRAGEEAVLQQLPQSLVVRTAWLYGAVGKNFMNTMLKLCAERETLRVVDDQHGSPTSTDDLARALWQLADLRASGIVHATNAGVTTWHGFASAIITRWRTLGQAVRTRDIVPVTSEEFVTEAVRPTHSALSGAHLQTLLGQPMRSWQEALHAVLDQRLQLRPADHSA